MKWVRAMLGSEEVLLSGRKMPEMPMDLEEGANWRRVRVREEELEEVVR